MQRRPLFFTAFPAALLSFATIAACSGADPGVSASHRARDASTPSATLDDAAASLPSPANDAAPANNAPATSDDAGTGADAADASPPLACVMCINAGGDACSSANGRAYLADTGADTGDSFSSTSPIAGTNDQTLYQTEHYGNAFTYTLQAPNGAYTLNLLFAEIYWTAAGQRVFDVDVQGARVLDNYDIIQDVGAANTAVVKTFPVTVTDGTVTIAFTSVTDNAKVSAIELLGPATAVTAADP